MKLGTPAIVLALMLVVGPVSRAVADQAAATQPSSAQPSFPDMTSANQMVLMANEDMGKNDYKDALPLLQKVEQLLADAPDEQGPILEQIRVCRHQIALAASKPAPPPVQLSVVAAVDGGERKIHPLPTPGQVVESPIKELGNFDYDATVGGNIPADVLRMDGCTFKTSGYMIPLDQAESISQFALVPSLFSCCFGQPPQIQHTIIVQCPKGKALSYFSDELTVEGTLHVKEVKDGGFIVSIFQMDASSVHASPQ